MVKEEYNTENPKNIEKQIVQFKQTMLDKHKSGEVIELNDAVWMMEATFNYYHGFTGEDYIITVTDSTYIPVAYSGFDNVPVEELQQLFVKANNAIVASFEAYPAQNKKPYMFDLELQATTQGSQLLVMTTVGTIETRKSGAGVKSNPFDDDDYWNLVHYYDGPCRTHDEHTIAERKWEKAIRRYFHPCPQSIWSISDISYTNYIAPEEYPINSVPFDCAENYRLYKGTKGCMTPDMMNFYYYQFKYIVNDRKPAGKDMADIYIQTNKYQHPNKLYEVKACIKYGVISYTPDMVPCEPDPL